MRRYALADYLRPEWAKAICRAKYRTNDKRCTQLLADDAYCPLGVLSRDGIAEYCADPSAPDGKTFAFFYSRSVDFLDDAELEECARSAQEFIDDWDSGRVTPDELPYVLGVIDWPQTKR